MSDIVERLQRMSHHDGLGHREACAEAADEIERLREELRNQAMQHLSDFGQYCEWLDETARQVAEAKATERAKVVHWMRAETGSYRDGYVRHVLAVSATAIENGMHDR